MSAPKIRDTLEGIPRCRARTSLISESWHGALASRQVYRQARPGRAPGSSRSDWRPRPPRAARRRASHSPITAPGVEAPMTKPPSRSRMLEIPGIFLISTIRPRLGAAGAELHQEIGPAGQDLCGAGGSGQNTYGLLDRRRGGIIKHDLGVSSYQDETLVQHRLAVQAGLSQSSKINALAFCWAPDIPMRSLCFPRSVPNRKGHRISAA